MLDDRLTEQRNPRSGGIDRLSSLEIVRVINAEDALVAAAVGQQAEAIARAADLALAAFRVGGRLIYVGAGTSGRLGVLDAAEMPPTYGTDPGMVQGVIAGGFAALVQAQEGAEDHPADGAATMDEKAVGTGGLRDRNRPRRGRRRTCTGRSPARENWVRGTGFLLCTPPPRALMVEHDVVIAPLTGAEVITGSTRMKAGTATRWCSTRSRPLRWCASGRWDGNLMVDLRVTCEKLQDRGERSLVVTLGIGRAEARELLARARGHVKTALVMHRLGLDADGARPRWRMSVA